MGRAGTWLAPANVSRETMPAAPTPSEWIIRGEAWGLSLTAAQATQLASLAAWLADRAFPLGLTNYRTAADLATHFLLPTFAFSRLAGSAPPRPVLDLGAGSGALGLTLAILYPDTPLVLADRRQRAATFMNLTRARLGLDNVEVRQVSAEVLAKSSGSGFAAICFRALAPAGLALPLVEPLLASCGWVAAWHQADDEAFLSPPPGWSCRSTVATDLPGLVVSRIEIVSRETILTRGP